MKRLIIFIFGLLSLVGCANQNAQDGTATDTCAVAVVDTVVPVYQHVEAIDLGLSVLWADRNLGASEPADCGGYYPSLKAQDTINALLGNGWRLPTIKEMEELFHKFSWGGETYLIDAEGIRIRGRYFGKKDGVYIFMPTAGYMVGELNEEYSTLGLYTTSGHTFNGEYNKGLYGGYWDEAEEVGYIPWHEIRSLSHNPNFKFSIRPVKDK